MNHDEVQQLTNNNLMDLISYAGVDHLEGGNIGRGIVDRICNSRGLKALRQYLLMLDIKGM